MKERLLDVAAIDTDRVLAVLGYTRDNPPASRILGRIGELCASVSPELKGLATTAKITGRKDGFVSTRSGRVSSRAFADLARKAGKVVYAVVTAGNGMDQLLYSSEDILDQMIFDALGSVLVEQGVDSLRKNLADESGEFISLPFSPGYCDFPLAEQKVVMEALGGSPLGISYHPSSFMMTPVKTISFIAAAGSKPLNTNPCSLCRQKKCRMRRNF